MRLSKWLRNVADRRRSPRAPVEGLTAVYWSGGVASPRPVHELSLHGAVIDTPDDWYPGTLLHLVLEPARGRFYETENTPSCGIWAKVVRRREEGVCVEFEPRDRSETAELQRFIRTRAEETA